MIVEGRELELWTLRSPFAIDMVIMHCVGSEHRERIAIRKLLLTEAGEFVLISTPFQNLAKKEMKDGNDH